MSSDSSRTLTPSRPSPPQSTPVEDLFRAANDSESGTITLNTDRTILQRIEKLENDYAMMKLSLLLLDHARSAEAGSQNYKPQDASQDTSSSDLFVRKQDPVAEKIERTLLLGAFFMLCLCVGLKCCIDGTHWTTG